MTAPSLPAPQLLIDGKPTGASNGATFPIVNPATEEVIGHAPEATAEDVDAAIAAARRAFDQTDWSTNLELRVRCLRQLHQALVDNGEQMRALTTAEAGAPAFLTAGPQYDVPVESFKWVVDLAESFEWETDLGVASPMGVPTRRTVRREAVGVVAAITPWNFPNQINLAKIGPALAAGNTVGSSPHRTRPGLRASSVVWSPSTPTSRPGCSTCSLRGTTRWPAASSPTHASTWSPSRARLRPAARSWRRLRRR